MVPTGQTMAEYWADAMVDDRRELLAQAFEELTVLPGKKGPKGFDPARLRRRWAQEADAGAEGSDQLTLL
ncbi:hypothetical protein AB0E27_20785 [Streptomyces sparsogenes]